MNSNIFKFIALGTAGIAFLACDNLEDKLLESKIYFENVKNTIEVDGDAGISIDLKSRLTSAQDADVTITYEIAGESAVKEYNDKNGTQLEPLKGASLGSASAHVKAGDIYADAVKISVPDVSSIEEGKSYLLPVRIASSSTAAINGSDMTYFIVKKPVKIFNVGSFSYQYVTLPLTANNKFTSCTYEALINVSRFPGNATIMGCEGVMILRIGDSPSVASNQVQVAGKVDFLGPKLEAGKWYHIALVCDGEKGSATIYLNGEKYSEAGLASMPETLVTGTEGFSVGLVPGFKWGERPFYGMMSEVRLWTVPRTANQIKENMLSVDPNSDGLLAYYKLNASPIVDASPNGMNPKAATAGVKALESPLMGVD